MKHLIVLFILFFLLAGCEQSNAPIDVPPNSTSGNVALTFDKSSTPAAVKTITTILSRSGFSSLERTLDIYNDTTAVILFDKIAVGTWQIKVDAKNESGQTVYTGQSEVIVLEGTVSMVNIVMAPVATGVGSVQINVSWGQPAGQRWVDFEFNAVLSKSSNPHENVGVSQPRIYKINDKYYMYYQMIGRISAVGLAISADGVVWSKRPNPVLSADSSSWDAGGTVPGPILTIDSTFIMLYQAYSPSEGSHFIGIAQSTDGINWRKPLNNKVAIGGKYISIINDVIRIDNKYMLYYSDYEPETGYRAVYSAVSIDAITWTKSQSQPILKKTYPWETGGVYCMTVIAEEGKYTAVYSDAGTWTCNFGSAVSVDGITWTKQPNPIFTNLQTYKKWANAGISYPALVKVGNQKRMYYMGAVGAAYERRIGFAFYQ
jgi:predicted GH43/DUF377 family glycosyl hydrolase